jgi:hypothetical protein
MYETLFPSELIEPKELQDVVGVLSDVTDQKAEVSAQTVVTTESLELSTLLDNLLEAMTQPKPVKTKTKSKSSAPAAGKRSIEVNGAVISMQAFNKRLAAHEFTPGTIVKSPLHGKGNIADDGETVLWGLPE